MATFVNFNLGGKYFTTTKDTVLREPSSRLALVVRGILPSTKDNTDAYFIDRDAKYFQLILNYLRYYVSRHGWLQQQNKARKSGRMMDLLITHHSYEYTISSLLLAWWHKYMHVQQPYLVTASSCFRPYIISCVQLSRLIGNHLCTNIHGHHRSSRCMIIAFSY